MNEISFKDFMECIGYKPGEGAAYGWHCYGHDAYALDSSNPDDRNQSVSIVYNTKTQFVYELEAWDSRQNRAYKWIHPSFVESYKAEAAARGVNTEIASDNMPYIVIDLAKDILEKASAIIAGTEYDDRVQIEITLPDNEMFQLMTLAHENDMTLNKYVELILTDIVAKAGKT